MGIDNRTEKITSFINFIELLRFRESSPNTRYFYRGLAKDYNKNLLPSIGRGGSERFCTYHSDEQKIFQKFKNQSIPFLKNIPRTEME
jgi:hypothetical protein